MTCSISSLDIPEASALRTLECTAPSRSEPTATANFTRRASRSLRGPSRPALPTSSHAAPSFGKRRVNSRYMLGGAGMRLLGIGVLLVWISTLAQPAALDHGLEADHDSR